MPRTKEQNADLRHQRKREILHAALSVYVEKGYAASEISDVAERAGVGKGLVHYYFKNKVNLFRELFSIMMEMSNQYMESVFNRGGPSLSLFEQYIKTMYQNVFENKERVLFYMRMPHDLKIVFSEDEIKQFTWPNLTIHVLSEAISRGIESGEIRAMSPKLLAVQLSGALFNGLAYFIRPKDTESKDTPIPPETFLQDVKDATESCMKILQPAWRWTHD